MRPPSQSIFTFSGSDGKTDVYGNHIFKKNIESLDQHFAGNIRQFKDVASFVVGKNPAPGEMFAFMQRESSHTLNGQYSVG